MDVTRTLLKCLSSSFGDKIRNEEAINSTRDRISSIKFFYVLLYRRSSTSWDIDVSYRVRRLVSELFEYAYKNARKSRASIREKKKSLPKRKNVMNTARHRMFAHKDSYFFDQ